MLPLLRPGDRIFVDETDQARSDLHDGDIIALRRNDAIVLKRIVAMQGETISGDHRKVFRNGKQLDEPYLAASIHATTHQYHDVCASGRELRRIVCHGRQSRPQLRQSSRRIRASPALRRCRSVSLDILAYLVGRQIDPSNVAARKRSPL